MSENEARHNIQECPLLDMKWETLDTSWHDGKLLLRRLVLERLGWRLYQYPDQMVCWNKPEYDVGYCRGEQGQYHDNPNYHWYPPALSLESLLAPHDWSLHTCTINGKRGYSVTVYGPHGTGASTDDDLEIAAYCALLAALDYSVHCEATDQS